MAVSAGKMNHRIAQRRPQRVGILQEGVEPAPRLGQDLLVAQFTQHPDQARAQELLVVVFVSLSVPPESIEDASQFDPRISLKRRALGPPALQKVEPADRAGDLVPDRPGVVVADLLDEIEVRRRRCAARLDQRPGYRRGN